MREDSPQLLVPLLSPSDKSIQFWVEPFDENCKSDLRSVTNCFPLKNMITKIVNFIRIDFGYSRNNRLSKTNKFGCSICANTIYGAQFVNSQRRHLVSIEGTTIRVYEDGIRYPNASQSIACLVNLRKWEGENLEQF